MLCCGYCVNDIFIFAMICRRNKFLDVKVKRINLLLKLICEENGYFFIDNSNIEIRDLMESWYTSIGIKKDQVSSKFYIFLK